MKKQGKRLLALVLAMLMAMLCLTACGKQSNTETNFFDTETSKDIGTSEDLESDSSYPEGIYAQYRVAPSGNEEGYILEGYISSTVYVYCVFSDGKISEHIIESNDSTQFQSTKNMLSGAECNALYEHFEYKAGQLVSKTSEPYLKVGSCLKISDDVSEFDGKATAYVFKDIQKRI